MDYVDSKGELFVCETLDYENMRSPDGTLKNPMLERNSTQSKTKLKYVSLTNDAGIISRSRANNHTNRSMLNNKNTNEAGGQSMGTVDSKKLINNNLNRLESKKNLGLGVMLVNAVSLKNLLSHIE